MTKNLNKKSMIWTWFIKLKGTDKIATIIIFLLVLAYLSVNLQLRYTQNQLLKQSIEYREEVREKKKENSKKQDNEIDTGTNLNKEVPIVIKKRKLKSKKDAEAIDNSEYSDAELDSLLASY